MKPILQNTRVGLLAGAILGGWVGLGGSLMATLMSRLWTGSPDAQSFLQCVEMALSSTLGGALLGSVLLGALAFIVAATPGAGSGKPTSLEI